MNRVFENQFPHSKAGFHSTCWSVVLDAARLDEAEKRQTSFGKIYAAYLSPLYAFARGRGYQPDEAMDLVQGFFTHLLEKRSLTSVSPAKGRFRCFLLASLKNYLANYRRAQNAERNGGKALIRSIDQTTYEESYQETLSDGCTPDSLFNQCWLETVLNSVLLGLRSDYEKAGKLEIFEAIVPYLEGDLPRHKIAEELSICLAAVAMSLSRMRLRYREILHRTIAETVSDPSDVESELIQLFEIASAGSPSPISDQFDS